MATLPQNVVLEGNPEDPPPREPLKTASVGPPVLPAWLRAQALNVNRHATALRPFRREEFGTGPAAPTEGHVQAVNRLISQLRGGLLKMSKSVTDAAAAAIAEPESSRLQRLVVRKDRAHRWVQGIEKIWDFYFELFGQRQSQPYGDWLLSCDRIATDCYQAVYANLGTAKSIPAPPPFCFMRTGFAPSTIRRGIALKKLGRQLNPFPLVQLPYHRLINPWTLGAVMHEVSHNLQTELGLSKDVPRSMARRLLKAGMGTAVTRLWTRWNREMFADMNALLLGGPEVLGSLMDVVGRTPALVFGFNPRGVHPTPYLRTLISVELLKRMGFTDEAEQYRKAWTRIYSNPRAGNIPERVLKTFPEACAHAVDAMCFQPFKTLGGKSLAQVVRFQKKDRQMVEEAAGRLAAGVDPGIIPGRYLIAASRVALNRKLAPPRVITEKFYQEIVRR
ncbi:MAG TPA: hypothetical protein VKU19_21735 [Bryobacteraceae bacterium]|nr:hypothetical protein [Bryobacteraceae bacterium]